jgi:hypothetical protein
MATIGTALAIAVVSAAIPVGAVVDIASGEKANDGKYQYK